MATCGWMSGWTMGNGVSIGSRMKKLVAEALQRGERLPAVIAGTLALALAFAAWRVVQPPEPGYRLAENALRSGADRASIEGLARSAIHARPLDGRAYRY